MTRPRGPFSGRPVGRPAARKFLLCAVVLTAAFASCRFANASSSPREAAKTGPAVDSAAPQKTSPPAQKAPVKPPSARPATAPRETTGRNPDHVAATASPPIGAAPAATDSLRPAPLRDLRQTALKAPETLLFDVIWGGWSFRWVHAGQATLELLPGDKPEHWEIRSLAWCNRFFRQLYPVHDTVTSLIDARGIYPLRFEKRLHEGSYHADISAVYDQARHTLETQDTTLTIEPFTHDVLSAFYYIRTRKLKVGDSFELAAVSGKKKYGLKVLCHGKETIKVPAGEFHTLVVEPVLKGDGLFKAKGKLTIWVTDDEAHMPVKMESKIPVGSIKAELVSKTP